MLLSHWIKLCQGILLKTLLKNLDLSTLYTQMSEASYRNGGYFTVGSVFIRADL